MILYMFSGLKHENDQKPYCSQNGQSNHFIKCSTVFQNDCEPRHFNNIIV